jgi:hypothetical protein
MLTPEERNALRTSRIARFYEMARQFEVVTAIYPAQRLRIYVTEFDIRDIMHCTSDIAVALINKIGVEEKHVSKWRIRTSVFCDHMDIDEMLIQVFLASLYLDEQPLPPKKRLPVLSMDEIAGEQPRRVYELRDQLKEGFRENAKTLALRAKLYEKANPDGEPMYKRVKWVQMVIRAFEVAQIYGCHINTAQAMLREVREKDREQYADIPQRRYVSIKKFCAVHNEDEADLRKHLAELHGPDDDDEDYD